MAVVSPCFEKLG